MGAGRYEGRTIQRLADAPAVFSASTALGEPHRAHRSARQSRMDRAARTRTAAQRTSEIVLAEPLPHHQLGLKPARVIERLGQMGDARSVSLIAIHTHDIPQTFPAAALAEADARRAAPLGRRTDLRDIPLVTIDGEDARDFDDAVFAEPDGARLSPDRRDRRRGALRAARLAAGHAAPDARQ